MTSLGEPAEHTKHPVIEIATCTVRLYTAGLDDACLEPQVAVCDVPVQDGTVELALCAEHLRLLHESPDPIETARKWLP